MVEKNDQRDDIDGASPDALDVALGIAFGAKPHMRSADETCTQIGRYKLLEQIGEGGFGVVYMAEQQEPIRRRVALKIIKLGMDTKQVIARFEAERQALALMAHENIAGVLDAGTTETGRPYFVMELVRGIPITDYCDRNKLNTKDRLKLFASICKAVQHAHQKGIIHRDLKPSNVMVTLRDGLAVPKVIDFGIAKATQSRLTEKTVFTRFGQFIGTPAYTSPEQIEMSELDADTRSDIYSLGVLLYELLTGSTPIEHEQLKRASYVEMQRMICDQEPPKPSTRLSQSGEALASISAQRSTEPKRLGPLIRGELDWIVMKAIEKDRTRRYESANGLAADVLRYLNDEPVVAGPPSATYKLRKFVRRNHKLVGTIAVIVLLLILGTAFSTWQALRASDAERLAQDERDVANQVRDSLLAEQRRAAAADQRRQAERVAALLTASPESVPLLVDEMSASRENVLPLIQGRMQEANRFEDRLRLAIARTLLDDPLPQFLADSVPQAQPKELANLLRAFRVCRKQALPILQQQFESAGNVEARFRFAGLLLELGNPQSAAELLALNKDPTTRTGFIHAFQNWHGDLDAIPQVLLKQGNGALQSGLAIALGRLDPKTVSADVCDAIRKALLEVYLTSDDGGAHSASGWALQRWGVPLPIIPPAQMQSTRRWFVNTRGQTMIVLGTDSPDNAPHGSTAARFPWTFAIGDREVSVELFRQFLDDPNCPHKWKPNHWPDVDRQLVPSDDCPVHKVSLTDCMLFCNWVSRAENRGPCYEQDDAGQWWCHFDRNGYRLPAVDEWEHACYAGATTGFPFGNDEFLLPEYGNLLLRRTQPGARLIPNAWGVFDMLGNLWEMCHPHEVSDVFAAPQHRSNPKELFIRGATFGTGSYYSNRERYPYTGDRTSDSGFRVLCRMAPTPDGLRIPRESLVAWWDDQIAADPANLNFRIRRANLQIQFRRWNEAAADYQILVQQQPNEILHWVGAAALLAQTENVEAYRRIRRGMLQQFREVVNPVVTNQVCKACLLLPIAHESDVVFQLADDVASENSPDAASAHAQAAKGLAEYRAGRFYDAIKRLEHNREVISGEPFLLELNLAVLAMAYYATDQHELARNLLDEFTGTLDATIQDTSGKQLAVWHDLLMAQVVSREARAMVGATP